MTLSLNNFVCLFDGPAPEVLKEDRQEGKPQREEAPESSQKDQASGSDCMSVCQEGGQHGGRGELELEPVHISLLDIATPRRKEY